MFMFFCSCLFLFFFLCLNTWQTWASSVLGLGGIISLCETVERFGGLENGTRASTDIVSILTIALKIPAQTFSLMCMLHRKTFKRQDFLYGCRYSQAIMLLKSVFKKGKNKALFKLKEKHWLRVVLKPLNWLPTSTKISIRPL